MASILATAASIILEVRISNGWRPKMRKKSTWHDRISQKEAIGTEKINLFWKLRLPGRGGWNQRPGCCSSIVRPTDLKISQNHLPPRAKFKLKPPLTHGILILTSMKPKLCEKSKSKYHKLDPTLNFKDFELLRFKDKKTFLNLSPSWPVGNCLPQFSWKINKISHN